MHHELCSCMQVGKACLARHVGQVHSTSTGHSLTHSFLRLCTHPRLRLRLWPAAGCMSCPGGGSPFTSFSFSENGYHVAAVAPGSVSIWDLRKMKCYK